MVDKRYNLRPRGADGKTLKNLTDPETNSRVNTTPPPTKREKARKMIPAKDDTPKSRKRQISRSPSPLPRKSVRFSENRPRPIRSPLASPSSSTTSLTGYSISEREPQATFEDLKGLEKIIEGLKDDVVGPFSRPRRAKKCKIDLPRGVLFVGEPGTGKTMLADAIVTEIRKECPQLKYYTETGQCLCKWVGESEGRLRELFRNAHENSPSVIFLDELDGIARKRDGNSSNFCTSLITTLLTEISSLNPDKVLLIAATNNYEALDPAVKRKGRIDLTLEIPEPNTEAKKQILTHYLNKKDLEFSVEDVDKIVTQTEDFTLVGSDIECLVKDIYKNAMKRVFPNREWKHMSHHELDESLENVKDLDWGSDIQPALDELKNLIALNERVVRHEE